MTPFAIGDVHQVQDYEGRVTEERAAEQSVQHIPRQFLGNSSPCDRAHVCEWTIGLTGQPFDAHFVGAVVVCHPELVALSVFVKIGEPRLGCHRRRPSPARASG